MIEDHPPIWVYNPSFDAQHADESTLTAASGTRGGYPSFDHATPKRGLLGTTSPPKLWLILCFDVFGIFKPPDTA